MNVMEQPSDTQDSGAAAEDTRVVDQHLGEGEGDIDQSQTEGEDSEEQTAQEETDEIEVDGQKFALPKSAAEKLKAERMMNADYTQKTQALADERRQFQAQAAQQQQQQQEYVQDVAKVVNIDDQLAHLRSIELTPQVWAQNPAEAAQVVGEIQRLEALRNTAIQSVTQKQQQFALNEQQAFAKQVQEANEYVAREIPNWSPERDTQLQKFVQQSGIPQQSIGRLLVQHPQLFKILHQAELYSQLEKKQATKPKPAAAPAPVTRVGAARANPVKDPSKMSDAEWYRMRQEKQRKR